jgi:hypothetical protein
MKREGMKPQNEDLRNRTKYFALRIIKLYSSLPRAAVAQTLGKQLLRSGTSVRAKLSRGVPSTLECGIHIEAWRLIKEIGRNKLLAGITRRFSNDAT